MEWNEEHYKNIYEEKMAERCRSPYYLECRLITNISNGNLGGALHNLKQSNEYPKSVLSDNKLRSAQNSMICSCTFFARATINAGLAPDIAFSMSDEFIRRIEKFTTIEETLSYEQHMLVEYVRKVQDVIKEKYPQIVILCKQYIDSHLNEDISLDHVAKKIHVNKNYLSNIFKKTTGETLTNYVNRQKIIEASYFIAYTDYEISDIAFLYKFCNQAYFTKLFKQYMGKTPREYKKAMDYQSRAKDM